MSKTLLALVGVFGFITTGNAAAKQDRVAVSAADLKWTEVPDSGGVQVAPLSGDMMKGPHSVMVKFPAGARHPLHTHSADLKAVVIAGEFLYGPEGGPEKAYGPGSFVLMPGGAKHSSGCSAKGPCTMFQEGSGKFDIKFVGAGKSAKK
jgi:quercetin dioxygenase-like cupin family protein